jgi:hypothetical protein
MVNLTRATRIATLRALMKCWIIIALGRRVLLSVRDPSVVKLSPIDEEHGV